MVRARTFRRVVQAFAALLGAVLLLLASAAARAQTQPPIKIGFSMALTGAVAVAGKQCLLALEIWRDDVNAKGGLLGRPVEFVYYDDQSNPGSVPPIYTKLLDVDKVDLLIGPYATNMVAPVIPVIMQKNLMTIGLFANAANSQFHYQRYFSMLPTGPEPKKSFSTGFYELAQKQSPKPQTVAILAADAEFAQNAAEGSRENAKAMGFKIIYDQSYPPATTDYAPIMRAVQAANADLVFVAAYPPDTVGIVSAANEIDLKAKMFGGTFIGLLSTPLKMKLGPLANGIVNSEAFPDSPSYRFNGTDEVLRKYRARAAAAGADLLGTAYVPLSYAAGQVLAQAVTATKTLDQDKLAAYIRTASFDTAGGPIKFGKDGEWVESRMTFTQFQHVTGNDLGQFTDPKKSVLLWPFENKSGEMLYPYTSAKK
jgi:branched-chain amino acid transport system substrate-binding protein